MCNFNHVFIIYLIIQSLGLHKNHSMENYGACRTIVLAFMRFLTRIVISLFFKDSKKQKECGRHYERCNIRAEETREEKK